MSYTFPASALLQARRWLHLPSLAILALAGTGAYATDRVVDAWSATQPRAREEARDAAARVVSIRGAAERRGLRPDRIAWAVNLSAYGRTPNAAQQQLARKREQLYVVLGEIGIPDGSMRMVEAGVEAQARTTTTTLPDGSTREDSVPLGYEASQSIAIESTDVVSGLAWFHAARASHHPDLVAGLQIDPRCTLQTSGVLEGELQREAQADLRRRAEETVRTLGHGELDELTGLDLGRLQLTESPMPCQLWNATVEVSATYRLR